jgi:hypothetical protein
LTKRFDLFAPAVAIFLATVVLFDLLTGKGPFDADLAVFGVMVAALHFFAGSKPGCFCSQCSCFPRLFE